MLLLRRARVHHRRLMMKPHRSSVRPWRVAKVVTMFTVAHTITFSLAALDILPLPPDRVTESIIAASIGLAALHNLKPVAVNREWMIAFVFGLFHGMGFAGPRRWSGSRSGHAAAVVARSQHRHRTRQTIVLAVFQGCTSCAGPLLQDRDVLRLGGLGDHQLRVVDRAAVRVDHEEASVGSSTPSSSGPARSC
ncbi:MAG: HupE/UreJ family protein [Ilumatobacteraceae bacterium]